LPGDLDVADRGVARNLNLNVNRSTIKERGRERER
jgi:hypothetical protein